MAKQPNIRKIRPIMTLDTPLRDIPREWMLYVEPKILRAGYLPCWQWVGDFSQEGYPQAYTGARRQPGDIKKTLMRRLVASMFWEFGRYQYVVSTCGNRACLNPEHLVVTNGKPASPSANPGHKANRRLGPGGDNPLNTDDFTPIAHLLG